MEKDNHIYPGFIKNSVKDAIEKSKRITKALLMKYFTKATEETAEYYYEDNDEKKYYNIKNDKRDGFEKELCKLAEQHIKIQLKMIDKRNDNLKMMFSILRGCLAEDLNFTIFDIINDAYFGKYNNDLNRFYKDKLKVSQYRKEDSDKMIMCSKEEMDEHVKKLYEISRVLNSLLSEKEKINLKTMNYKLCLNEDDSKDILVLYIGCGVLFQTDSSWFNYYKSEM